jgi:hypothetical protein
MTEPKSLEELAAEWDRRSEREAQSGGGYGGEYNAGRAQVYEACATELQEWLAARPASDLEKRLRERAQVKKNRGRALEASELLEAVDALTRAVLRIRDQGILIAELERMLRGYTDLRTAEALKERDAQALRAAKLERELAARENVNFAFDATMRRAEAAEARLAPFAERIQVLAADVMRERDSRMAAEARLAAAQDIVREALADMSNQRAAIGPQRGMHVPWHGRFAGANPSVCKDIDRALTAISVALATPALPEET